MSKLVEVVPLSVPRLELYRKLLPRVCREAAEQAKRLRGAPVVHVSATNNGGGVAELLRAQVAWERSLGLDSHWLTIRAPKRFFVVTKTIHNLLQGRAGVMHKRHWAEYDKVNRELEGSLVRFLKRWKSGTVVIHDPQPLALIRAVPQGFASVLRFHIDLSTPNPTLLESFRPLIMRYGGVVVSNPAYRASLPWLAPRILKVIPPAIDPFSEKNALMNRDAACAVLAELGVYCAKPLMVQVSRFDPWKDPLGVIRAYYRAKNNIPDLQLVLAGLLLAQDDPEAASVFKEVKKHARGDPAIHLFANPRALKQITNERFINALYTASDVVVQKSIKEGFGLTITEAMWKGKVVVAGRTSGTSLQIRDGKNGLLVSSPEEAARAIVRVMKDRKLRRRLGGAARRSVTAHFLLPRFVRDNLKLYRLGALREGAV